MFKLANMQAADINRAAQTGQIEEDRLFRGYFFVDILNDSELKPTIHVLDLKSNDHFAMKVVNRSLFCKSPSFDASSSV